MERSQWLSFPGIHCNNRDNRVHWPFPARIPGQAFRCLKGCIAGLPNSMLGRGFAENRLSSHDPAGGRLRFPSGVFILHQGMYLLLLSIYFKGTGALSEGGSGFAGGLRSGLSPGCCWKQPEPEVNRASVFFAEPWAARRRTLPCR